MIYVDGIVLWLENCCRFKTLTVPNINSRFLFRCLSALSPSLLFGDCSKAWIVKLNATFLNNRPRKIFCNQDIFLFFYLFCWWRLHALWIPCLCQGVLSQHVHSPDCVITYKIFWLFNPNSFWNLLRRPLLLLKFILHKILEQQHFTNPLQSLFHYLTLFM